MKKTAHLRWIIWATLLVGMSVALFHRVAIAVIADQVMAEFNLSAVAFGNLAALYFYTYAAMQIPTGVLTDVLGPRKTVTLGLLTASLGSIIFGLASVTSVVYLGRFLASLGVAVIWVSFLKFLSEWFSPQEFGTMSGLAGTVAMLGALLAATPLALLVNYAGWRASFGLIGLVTFGIAAACWLVVRDRPTEVSLLGLSGVEKKETQQDFTGSSPDLEAKSLMTKLRMVFTNKYTWPAFLVGTLYGPFIAFNGTWGVPYLMQVYELSREAAANYALIGTMGMMIGLPAIGFISDKITGRRKLPILIFTLANLVTWAILILWNGGKPPPQILYPICFFMGFCGTAELLSHACVKEVNSPAVAGMAMGLTNTGVFLGSAVLQLLFGYVLDSGWQGAMVEGARVYPLGAYQTGFILCLVAVLVGTVGASLLKETRCQNIWQRN